jgi:hypothetical protein
VYCSNYFHGCMQFLHLLHTVKCIHVPITTIPCTDGNYSMDSWKSLEGNGSKGYGICNLYWSNYYFRRCTDFLHPFHTVKLLGNDSISVFCVCCKWCST